MRVADILDLSPPLGFAEIARRRQDVARELAAARDRREALLLGNDNDAAVAACDVAADRLHLALERLQAAETELRNRLHYPAAGMAAIRSTLR